MSRFKTMGDNIGKKTSTISLIPEGDYEMTVEKVEFKTIEAKATGEKFKLVQLEGRTQNTINGTGQKTELKNQLSIFIPASMPAKYLEFMDGSKKFDIGIEKGATGYGKAWGELFGYKSYEEAMWVLLHQFAGYSLEDMETVCGQLYTAMDDAAWAGQVTAAIQAGITAQGNVVKFSNEQYESKAGDMKQRQSLLPSDVAVAEITID